MQNKTFLYREIYQAIREQIASGELGPEDKLPTEDELARRYSVSKITVKKALEMLKDDGLILRVQGRGTFVRKIEPVESARETLPRSRLIGLVLEHVSSSFGLNMMYYIGRRLDAAGYKLCIRFTFGSIEKETEEINDLLKMNVAGLIIMPCHDSHYNMTILRLILENFPIVLVDKRMHGLPISSVCTDGREAMRLLVHHLKERGCENAAVLTIDPASTSSLGDRAEGFYKGLEETRMACAGEWILPRRTGNMISSDPEPQYVSEIGKYLDSLEHLSGRHGLHGIRDCARALCRRSDTRTGAGQRFPRLLHGRGRARNLRQLFYSYAAGRSRTCGKDYGYPSESSGRCARESERRSRARHI